MANSIANSGELASNRLDGLPTLAEMQFMRQSDLEQTQNAQTTFCDGEIKDASPEMANSEHFEMLILLHPNHLKLQEFCVQRIVRKSHFIGETS